MQIALSMIRTVNIFRDDHNEVQSNWSAEKSNDRDSCVVVYLCPCLHIYRGYLLILKVITGNKLSK
jgi:hypothetical protein